MPAMAEGFSHGRMRSGDGLRLAGVSDAFPCKRLTW